MNVNFKAESILRATIAADETAKLRWSKLLTVVEHVLNFSPQTATDSNWHEHEGIHLWHRRARRDDVKNAVILPVSGK